MGATPAITERESSAAGTFPARAYAAQSATSPLAPFTIPRRSLLASDVRLDILYCGVCHTDLHWAHNDWSGSLPTTYPCVPGHEIVGRVTAVGPEVSKFREGDTVAVGCMVDSCRTCPSCLAGEEQYCQKVPVLTYNAPDPHLGGMTYGGYSESIVVDEDFVLRVPPSLDPAAAAPLLCAGITTYAPLRRHNVRAGQKVGVVGLGGLGHMAVKFASAFGADVVVLTTSPHKKDDALRLGATEAVLSTSEAEMAKHMGTFDFILSTLAVPQDLNPCINLLKHDGTLGLVGVPADPHCFGAVGLLFGRRQIAGSLIGGVRETQEMLDFCAEHGIASDIEMIPMQQINQAFERIVRNDVKYRFVIDMASLK